MLRPSCPQASTSAPRCLLLHLQKQISTMQKHGLTRVYLATDCDDERELSAVRDALSPVWLKAGTPARTLRARTEHANLEITICAMAAHFRGTKTSSFSLAIVEERAAIFGHASDTASVRGPIEFEKSILAAWHSFAVQLREHVARRLLVWELDKAIAQPFG